MKLSLFQLSCTVVLCLFFSTVNSVVEGQLRGASIKPRQLQEGKMVAEEAKVDNHDHDHDHDHVAEKPPHTHTSEKHTHNSEQHTHNAEKPRKERKEKKEQKEKKSKKGPTTGDVDDIASNITAVGDDDFIGDDAVDDYDVASNSTAVDDYDVASNTTAADELDESDADEEEGEGEIRY